MKIKKSSSKDEDVARDLAKREWTPWGVDPFKDFDRFFSEFSRDFFDEFTGRYWRPRMAPWWSHGGGLALKTPLTDLKDTGKEYVMSVDMPGVSKDEVDITVHHDSVEIKAERESDKEEKGEDFYYRERGSASYYRRIPLPEDVDAEKAKGKMVDGVLELTIPKLHPTETKTKKIKL